MKERRAYRVRVKLESRNYLCDSDRMTDVFLPALAVLSLMKLLCVLICFFYLFDIVFFTRIFENKRSLSIPENI